jgi:hypothetical protein
MFKFFKDLWSAAYNLHPDTCKRTVRIAGILAVLLVVVVLFGAAAIAGRVVPAENPVWEAILQTRLAFVRMGLAIPVLILAAVSGVTLFQVLENTQLGKRLLIWADGDDPQVKAQKTRNAGALLSALILSCIVGLLLGVLR